MTAPLRILFIGNSYTDRNDLPGLLTRLAAASDPPVEVITGKVIANGASLRQHWNAGAAARLRAEEKWDTVVLQEQSTLPVKNAGRYHENVRLFAEAVRTHGARLALYLVWARRSAPESQQVLNEAARAVAAETGALVVPVGPAWERVRASGSAPELFDPDGSHPTLAGSYLAACVFYAALLRRTPEGLPSPPGVDREASLSLQRTARGVTHDVAW